MIVSMDPNVQPWQIECERLRAENARLKGELEIANGYFDLMNRSVERVRDLTVALQHHKDALKEAKWLVDNAPVATIHKEWRERANTFVATSKVLGERLGKEAV